jgi:hypothetical protein
LAAGDVVSSSSGIIHRAELADAHAVAKAQSVAQLFYSSLLIQPFARTGRPK